MIFLLGKSGSGKSTLLNIVGFLDKPSSGEIIVNGKYLTKFKAREIDAYRNTFIGFIFQDYNLIENLNVYKNLELAINLQKKKVTKEYLDNILKMVGIEGLGNRRVNELSGGQKQRVAIARALIKNPNIILADEPTGNLDSTTSEQIFSILKHISQEKLIVVVSHDVEFAKRYADRIIELVDGKIINDQVINTLEISNQDMKLVKSNLPFIKSLSFAFDNLRRKKLKLIFTTMLVTIALSLFGFATTLTSFDIERTHAETMISEKTTKVEINKKIKGKNFTTFSPVITFTQNEIKEVTDKLNQDIIKASKAVENNNYLSIQFAQNLQYDEHNKNYSYYDLTTDNTIFLEYSEQRLNDLKIIGKIPISNNEILIHKAFADYILKNGLLILGIDSKGNTIQEDYLPKDYNELVNSKKKIVFGSSYLVVSGIIDEDLSKYEELKTILSDEMMINPTKTYNEFKSKYGKSLYEVVVKNNFFDTFNLSLNNTINMDFYKTVYLFNDKRIHSQSQTLLLDKEITIYNGSKYEKISSLNNNEIIISNLLLDELFDYECSNKLKEYLKSEQDNYAQKVKEREDKLKEQEEALLEDPNYVVKDIPEVKSIDIQKLTEQFIINYLKENDIIGKTISIEINDLYLRTQKEKTKIVDGLKIVGYDFEGFFNNYLSKDLLNTYMRDKNEVISIYFDETDVSELKKVFIDFPSEDAKYVSKTIYTDTIKNVENVVKKVESISYYASFGFLTFAIILFTNFIVTSINNSKKDIGILRAIGARKIDIYKIFYLESYLIGLFSFLLSSVICFISTYIANDIISKDLFFNIKPIIFKIDTFYYLFGIVVIVTFIASILPISKIAKMKPVDSIYSK
jgi:ABC-type lipoprotein export system ATPase subunit/ABC-type antimicrobial peptide transport system permease subunit